MDDLYALKEYGYQIGWIYGNLYFLCLKRADFIFITNNIK
jgi:hypothetical protein